MNFYSICFSPTGGTRAVLKELERAWGEPFTYVDLSAQNQASSSLLHPSRQDVCLIGVPSFGGRVPAVALERLAGMTADGAAAVLVVTYGNRAYEDTLLELQDAAAACGFRTVAAIAAVTEHSIMHQYGTGRPDSEDLAELRRFGEQIRDVMRMESYPDLAGVPGNRPYREYKGVPLKPKAGSHCTGCGICAELCPAGAISREDPRRTDQNQCISCMRCVSVCPVKARTLNKAVLLAAGQMMKKDCAGRKKNELFTGGDL